MREIFFNEVDFEKGEVRLIKLKPAYIAGIRSKYIRVDPECSGLHSMECTVIDYNGREILVVEQFSYVVQTIASEFAANYWHDNAKFILPENLKRLSEKIKIIQDLEPKAVSRQDSVDQCELKDTVSRQSEE